MTQANLALFKDGLSLGLTAFFSVLGVLAVLYFFVLILQKSDKGSQQ